MEEEVNGWMDGLMEDRGDDRCDLLSFEIHVKSMQLGLTRSIFL